jgi:beta-fructofuranosidase
MVLSSKDSQGGLTLLYTTDDPLAAGGWHFENVLLRDTRYGSIVEKSINFSIIF